MTGLENAGSEASEVSALMDSCATVRCRLCSGIAMPLPSSLRCRRPKIARRVRDHFIRQCQQLSCHDVIAELDDILTTSEAGSRVYKSVAIRWPGRRASRPIFCPRHPPIAR
jgi:hypothetical protein